MTTTDTPSDTDLPPAWLDVAVMAPDGLWHGILMRDRPTPSGMSRPMLHVSCDTGRVRPADALEDIAKVYPDVPSRMRSDLPDLDPLPDLPPGTTVTLATSATDRVDRFAVVRGAPSMEPEVVERMVAAGRLVLDSTSGDDPEMHYRYDTYVRAG